jgi:flagellar assembly factor FliW
MQIESTRFGLIEIRDDAELVFPDGLIGLPGTRYALLSQADGSPFFWLHSLEHPEIALPVTSPWLFFTDYEVKVSDDEARKLELLEPEQADVFCVVKATEAIEDFSINLVGPVIIHAERRLGAQIINEIGGYSVRQPLFSEVELNHVQPASSVVPVAATVA